MIQNLKQPVALQTHGFRVWSGKSPVGENMPPHRHNELELNFIERGSVTYTHAGRHIQIQTHEHAVFWGAVPHQLVDCTVDALMGIVTIPMSEVLRWELPQDFVLALLSGSMFCSTDRSLLTYTDAMFRQWYADAALGHRHIALMEIKAFLYRCALLWPSETEHTPVDDGLTVPVKAQQMARVMNEQFQESISASDVAAQVGLNANYAMSTFKSAFGVTITDYLTQRRIAYAQQQLLTTDVSVTDIALDAGFHTLSHFYVAFKNLCGHSPGKYRALLRRV
ncbi:MAG: helix-turn-helix domain-containing protein [Anaerolineae bacterium]|nr:helix-turn-helix domain-containing protein [Anaerolineae bacterium]